MSPRKPKIVGFHDNMPEDKYHGHKGSLSQSGAKLILKAPALYRWEQEHRTEKRAWDLGHYAHAKVLGVGAEVVPLLRTDPKTGDTWEADSFSSPSVGKHAEEVRAAGKIPLLRKEIEQVNAMADKLSEHRMAMRLLKHGRPEVSMFARDEETGVLRRGRVDWLGDRIVSDYKTAVSANPDDFGRVAMNFGYAMQAPWYLDMLRDLGHDAQAFAFIVQEKDPPYLVSVVELDNDALEWGRARNRLALQMFRDCTEAGTWPGYLADDLWATVSLPRWATAS